MQNKFKIFKVSFLQLLILCIFLSGCSYRFGSAQRAIPGGYNKLTVPVFKNKTEETGSETFFTSALINEIERGGLASVASRNEAQLLVEGIVSSIELNQEAQVKSDTPGYESLPDGAVLTTGYRIVAGVTLVVKRLSDYKVVWSGTFSGERRYSAPQVTPAGLNTVNPLYNHSAKNNNIEILAKEMMSEAYDRMTENF